ncbi:hypothetical protein [Limnothrix redekei]|uniref:Uncharacterized protein n=1 Tax=Limnothrix redekei LRLZ20PSL1 TaxID=3112953 RepID=A0ABW7CF03_9CYAN
MKTVLAPAPRLNVRQPNHPESDLGADRLDRPNKAANLDKDCV